MPISLLSLSLSLSAPLYSLLSLLSLLSARLLCSCVFLSLALCSLNYFTNSVLDANKETGGFLSQCPIYELLLASKYGICDQVFFFFVWLKKNGTNGECGPPFLSSARQAPPVFRCKGRAKLDLLCSVRHIRPNKLKRCLLIGRRKPAQKYQVL